MWFWVHGPTTSTGNVAFGHPIRLPSTFLDGVLLTSIGTTAPSRYLWDFSAVVGHGLDMKPQPQLAPSRHPGQRRLLLSRMELPIFHHQ